MALTEPSKADLDGSDKAALVLGYGASALIDGWLVMLAFGLAVGCGAKIPAFGYWACVFFAFVAAQVFGTSLGSTTLRIKNLGR